MLKQDEIISQNEVLEMARQSNLLGIYADEALDSVTRFAKLVADVATAKEREECAKVADEWVKAYQHPSEVIARTIRARGGEV